MVYIFHSIVRIHSRTQLQPDPNAFISLTNENRGMSPSKNAHQKSAIAISATISKSLECLLKARLIDVVTGFARLFEFELKLDGFDGDMPSAHCGASKGKPPRYHCNHFSAVDSPHLSPYEIGKRLSSSCMSIKRLQLV